MMKRRHWMIATALAPWCRPGLAATDDAAVILPRDEAAHPDAQIEWWYATGWLGESSAQPTIGFQVTFFRARRETPVGASRFATAQLVFAHAAIADPAVGRLLHDQNIAREGFGFASAARDDFDLKLGHWRFRREASGRYRASVESADFAFDLALASTQAPMLQGDAGHSQKGPASAQWSHYYSLPHLSVDGHVRVDGRSRSLSGQAWFDHEWSDSLLPADAAGWDWIGINLDDGSALMAFRVRDHDGRPIWSDAAWRGPDGRVTRFDRRDIAFDVEREWASPRSGTRYPVAQRITLGSRRLEVIPLMDDQELDSRQSAGVVYWEGAVTLHENGRAVGRGYLELTGYAGAFKGIR